MPKECLLTTANIRLTRMRVHQFAALLCIMFYGASMQDQEYTYLTIHNYDILHHYDIGICISNVKDCGATL